MALKKRLSSNNIDATYWKIVGFNLSVTGKMCQVFLVGYANVYSRAENNNISSKNYMMTEEHFDKYISLKNGVLIADLYGFLKNETEDFKDSEDI